MALSYRRVTRTTGLVEDALYALDQVMGCERPLFRWEWREAFTTPQIDGEPIRDAYAVYRDHEVFIKVKGYTKDHAEIIAIVKFTGFTHEFEEDDQSEPLAPEEITLTIKTSELSNGFHRDSEMVEKKEERKYSLSSHDGWFRSE